MRRIFWAFVVIGRATGAFGEAVIGPMPLTLESKVALGDVLGRIDHLAVDVARQRLYARRGLGFHRRVVVPSVLTGVDG